MYPKLMGRFSGLLFLILHGIGLPAQNIIPVLGTNDRYGFADSAGNILVPVQFKDAWLPDKQGVAWALDTAEFFHLLQKDGSIVPTGISINVTRSFPPYLYFKNGLCVIYTAPGSHNVLHYRRGLLFDRGYRGCTILNPEYIVLEDDSGRKALADSSGNLRTGFNFTDLSLAPLDGYFYAMPSAPDGKSEWKIIDQNGNSVLDATFQEPTIAGKTWIIAHKNRKEGLIDWDQREIMPFTFWSLQFIRDSLFLAEKSYPHSDQNKADGREEDVRYTILDIHNREYLPQPMGRLWYNSSRFPYFEAAFEFNLKYKWIMDSTFRIIHKDSFNSVDQSYDGRFRVGWNGPDGYPDRYGILDYTGRQIVPTEFRQIMELQQHSGYLVEKDGFWGFYSYAGQLVLPIKFAQIQHEFTDSTNLLWVNPYREKIHFTAYDLNGKQLSIPDQACPNPRFTYPPKCINEVTIDEYRKFILPDGSIVSPPWKSAAQYIVSATPHGCLVVAQADGDCRLFDARLKPILPKGYSIPEKYRHPVNLAYGLIPVNKGAKSGVINARGNWVIKPSNTKHIILRENMVADIPNTATALSYDSHLPIRIAFSAPPPTPAQIDSTGIIIHVLNHNADKRITVHYLGQGFLADYLLVGRLFKAPDTLGGKVMKYALLDTLGNLATPFIFKKNSDPTLQNGFPNDGEIYCMNGWVSHYRYEIRPAIIYMEDFREKQVLINEYSQIIYMPDSLSILNYKNGAAAVQYADKMGLIDSVGHALTPMIYEDIWVTIPGKIYCAKTGPERYQFFRFDGTPLPIDPVPGAGFKSKFLPDGYMALDVQSGWIILSPDYQVVTTLKAATFPPKPVFGFPALLEFKTGLRKRFYLNYRSGVTFLSQR